MVPSLLDEILVRIRWVRNRRYSRYKEEMDHVLGAVRDAASFREDMSERERKRTLLKVVSECKRACTCLAENHRRITGARCHACIKVLSLVTQSHVEDVSLTDLARDKKHLGAENESSDRDISSGDVQHTIGANTDFLRIIRGAEYFACNHLPFLPGYQNTSFGDDTPPSLDSPNPLSVIQRYKEWPLRYKSTIVVPITGEKVNFYGFLCIDSPRMWLFNSYDIWLMQQFADELYEPLSKVHLYDL